MQYKTVFVQFKNMSEICTYIKKCCKFLLSKRVGLWNLKLDCKFVSELLTCGKNPTLLPVFAKLLPGIYKFLSSIEKVVSLQFLRETKLTIMQSCWETQSGVVWEHGPESCFGSRKIKQSQTSALPGEFQKNSGLLHLLRKASSKNLRPALKNLLSISW